MADVRVVMQSLLDAHHGVATVMEELGGRDVADLAADPGAFGHDALGSVSADFCARWAHGIANLTDDGNALATGLAETVASYAEAEQLNIAEFR